MHTPTPLALVAAISMATALHAAESHRASIGAAAATKPTTPAARPAGPAARPASPAPRPSPTERVITASATELGKLLEQAGLDYEKQDNGGLKLLYRFTDGRSQIVFIEPMSDIREAAVAEIYSPVMRLQGPIPAAVAKRLLESNGVQKLGYFGVEDVEGKPWVFCYHNLPTQGLTSKSLAAVLITVAELADEMEKEQMGAATDEF